MIAKISFMCALVAMKSVVPFASANALSCAIVVIEGICGTTEYAHHVGDVLKKQGVNISYYTYKDLFAFSPEKFVNNCKKKGELCVWLQHYYWWWRDELSKQKWLSDFIFKAKKQGIKVHATIHEDFVPSPIEKEFILNLTSVIVHRDIQKLSFLEKAYFVLHPAPVFDTSGLNREELRKAYGFDEDDLIITTTGFLNVQKATPDIVSHLIPHMKKNKRIKLQLLCAAIFRDQSVIKDAITTLITESGIAEQIYFDDSFLSQKEINERLFLSDLGFSWNTVEQNSGSGIEKQFISSRLPYVVNKSPHFDGGDGAIVIPTDIELLARTLTTKVNHKDELDQKRSVLNIQYHQLNYNVMAEQYAKIFGLA